MTGRPRNANRHPATKFVRLTPEQHRRMREFHQGAEPYGDTFSRILQLAEDYRKKVQGLKDDNLALHFDNERLTEANKNLLKVQRQQAETITRYENPESILQEIVIHEQ